MALYFAPSGRVQVRMLDSDEAEDWPEPIRIGVAPDQPDLLELAKQLPAGMPLVVRLELGLTLDISDLVRVADLASQAGREVVVLLGDE